MENRIYISGFHTIKRKNRHTQCPLTLHLHSAVVSLRQTHTHTEIQIHTERYTETERQQESDRHTERINKSETML